jgi:TonB family protein
MMQKLGPALIGAALGMLLFWGLSKYLGEQAPDAGELPQASIAMPPLTPVDLPDDATLTAGIRGAESGELTAGIRGADSSEVVGTMVDRPPPAPADASTPQQPAACFDHEVVPRLVVAPDYPYSARVSGQRGEVAVEFTVGADGAVSEAAVVASEPPQVFDRAALEAVQQWRFDPRTQACAPVAARVRQTLQFRLDAGQ